MSGRVEPLIAEREGMWFCVDQATDRETKPLPHTFCFRDRDCEITFSRVNVRFPSFERQAHKFRRKMRSYQTRFQEKLVKSLKNLSLFIINNIVILNIK